MIPASTLFLFSLAAGALIVMPGPAVLHIVARSVHQGRQAGLVSALGVATGGLVHVAGAVLGFSALLASSAVAFTAVRWLGAAYLVFLGLRTLLTSPDAAATVTPEPAAHRRLFARGSW
jgi:threonine/homoserine/homoserine lactone efflux protein